MADLSKLRKQRGYVKGKLTRIEQGLSQVQRQTTSEDAEVRLEQLEQIAREFSEIQRQIINESDEPSVADTTAEAEFEERYLAVKVMLKRIINASRDASDEASQAGNNNATMLMQLLQRQMEIMERREANESPQSRTTSNVQEAEVDGPLEALLRTQTEILQRLSDGSIDGVSGGSKVKLPTFRLPTFDGKIEEWTHFSDTFTQTIHNNQKFAKHTEVCISAFESRWCSS